MRLGAPAFESVAMGGMFSVLKVRRNQKSGDYKDPGWYTQPPGTTAFEWTGSVAEPARFKAEGRASMPRTDKANEVEVQVRKPIGHMKH